MKLSPPHPVAGWPLRWKLVLPLVLLGLVLIGGGIGVVQVYVGRNLEQAHGNEARAIVTAISLAAETTHSLEELQRYVFALGAEPNIRAILVVGEQPPRILAGTRNRFIGKLLHELPAELVPAEALQATLTDQIPRHSWHSDGTVLEFLTPLRLNIPAVQERLPQKAVVLVHLDTESIWRDLRWIRRIMVILAIGVVVGVVGIAHQLISRLILRPAKQIRRVLDRLAAGDMAARVAVTTSDEMGQVAQALNHTLDALALEEQHFATLVHNIPGAVFRIAMDEDRTIVFVSDAIEEITGLHPGTFLNQPGQVYFALVHPDDLPRLAAARQHAIATRADFDMEYRLRHSRDGYHWVHVRGRLIVDATEQPVFLEGILLDVTARKHAEEELRQQKWRYQKLLETTIDGIHVLDELGYVVEVNQAFCEMLGYTAEEMRHMNLADWDAKYPRDQLLTELAKYLEYPGIFETRHRRKDGSIIDVEISATGVAFGGRHFVFCSTRDISERKQMEKRLRRTQYAVDHAGDMVYWVDKDAHILEVNEAVCQRLGYRMDQLRGLSVGAIDPTFAPHIWAHFWQDLVVQKQNRLETLNRTAQGDIFPAEVTSNYVKIDNEEFLCSFIRDMSERKKQERQLLEALSRAREFELLFQSSNVLVGIGGVDGYLQRINPAWTQTLGYGEEELLSRPFLDFVHPDFLWPMKVDQSPFPENGRACGENKVRCKDGSTRWISWHVAPDMERHRIFCVGVDITERKAAETALKENEEMLRGITSAALDGIILVDHHNRIIFWNDAAARIFGHAQEDVLGQNLHELVVPKPLLDQAFQGFAHFAQTGQGPFLGQTMQMTARRRDGSEFPVEVSISALQRGEHWQAVGIVRDITDRLRAARQLQESEETLRLTMEGADLGMWSWEIATGQVVWSREIEALFGLGPGSFEGTYEAFERCVHPDDRDTLRQVLAQTLAQRTAYRHAFRILWPDGSLHWVGARGKIYYDEHNQPLRMRGVVLDITQQKKLEEHLQATNESLSALVQAAPVSIQIVDRQGYLCDGWNPASEQIFGWTRQEALGQRPLYVPADKEQEFWEALQLTLQGQSFTNVERQRVRKDGSPIYISLATAPIRNQAGAITHCLAIISDITERKQAEQRLQLAAQVFANSFAGIFVTDADKNIISTNSAFTRLTGYTLEEVRGRNPRFLQSGKHDRVFYQAMWNSIEEKGFWQGEIWNKRKNGELFCEWLTISTVRDESGKVCHYIGIFEDRTEQLKAAEALRESEEKYRLFLQNFQGIAYQAKNSTWIPNFFHGTVQAITGYETEDFLSGRVLWNRLIVSEDLPALLVESVKLETEPGYLANNVYRICRQDGQVRWVNDIAQVIYTYPDGSQVIQGAIYDVTERKLSEEHLRASLREKEALLKEIHHRVKNNLQIISSLLSLQESRSHDPALVDSLRQSRNRVRSMALAHEGLYRTGDLSHIDLGQHVRSLCNNLRASYGVIPERIELHVEVEPVSLDLDHIIPLGLIINELVANAFKYAFPEGRTGWVRVVVAAQGKDKYTLTVADNGVGLPPSIAVPSRNSLGLQLVQALTQQLRGTLEVDRQEGTTFRITFAASAERTIHEQGPHSGG